jgi:tetratricopeptide (TPR) repeat protein
MSPTSKKRGIFLLLLITIAMNSCSQIKLVYPKFLVNSNWSTSFRLITYQRPFNYLHHNPDESDTLRLKAYRYLIDQQPTAQNYDNYYSLAHSLWDLEKTKEAEKMFLAIVNANESYYTTTYYHSSDVPGDKTTNVYGYGSFTSNYKCYAAICLTKIYLEQKAYDKAMQFLEDAVKKYKVTYTCGTGFRQQQDEYEFYYAACFAGLNRHKDVIDLLLPTCLERDDTIIISSIKKTYTKQAIAQMLKKAEGSIICSLNSFPSYATQTVYNKGKRGRTKKIVYYSGTATIHLFGMEIRMPVPNLENGERLTREMFVIQFRESNFYSRLNDEEEFN